MKYIIAIIFVLFSVSAFSQHEINLRIAPGKDPDTSNWLSFYPSGNGALTGRGVTKSYETLANILSPMLGCIDTIFVNGGDSLVIYTCIQDTIYFAGGGGSGLSDGDKGDITVSSGGTVWNIDANTIGTNEVINNDLTEDDLAANSVGASELQVSGVIAGTYPYPVNLKVDSDGRLTQVHDGQEPVTWDDTTSFIATFNDLISLRDSSWLELNTDEIPKNIDTTYRKGMTVMGSDSIFKDGGGVVQIAAPDAVPGSALDILTNYDYQYGTRWFNTVDSMPRTFINSAGAYYSRSWMVISALESGSGLGYSLVHPTNEPFMLGINSDIGGPGIIVRESTAPSGSYNIGGMDKDGHHTWALMPDGQLKWGIDTITNMDTELHRADSSGLATAGAFRFGWDRNDPTSLLGMNADRWQTKVYLDPDALEFSFDTIYLAPGAKNYAFLKGVGLVCNEADDNAEDIFHEGDVHIGYTTMANPHTLSVVGRMFLGQSLTDGNVFLNGGNETLTGVDNIAVGEFSGDDLTTGQANVLLGRNTGTALTEGLRNVAIGSEALDVVTTGDDNFALGSSALGGLTTGNNNIAIGSNTLSGANFTGNTGIGNSAGVSATGDYGVFIGNGASLFSTGNGNVAIGNESGLFAAGGSIAIGNQAGYFSDEANKLYIHNAGGSNKANGKIVSLIYGEMDATTANQLLHFNSKVLPRYMGGVLQLPAGYDASGYLTNSSWPVFIDSLEANGLSSTDADWYESGGTNPPNANTDNMFNDGALAIGNDGPYISNGITTHAGYDSPHLKMYAAASPEFSWSLNIGDDAGFLIFNVNNGGTTTYPFQIVNGTTVNNQLLLEADGDVQISDYPNSRDDGTPTNVLGTDINGVIQSYPVADVQPTTEAIQDIVGAMFTGNTETNVTVDYQDADGTIDVVVSASGSSTPYVITPAQLTSDQDNYAPTGVGRATYIYIDSDNGMRAITGIADSTAGTLEKTIINDGSYMIYLPMSHPDSDAAHRFVGWPGDYYIYPGHSVKILYDLVANNWRIIGGDAAYVKPTVFYSWSASGNVGLADHYQSVVSGSGAMSPTAASTTLPAYWSANTSTSSTARSSINLPRVGDGTAFAAAHIFLEATVSIPTLSDGTETFTVYAGITDIQSGISASNNVVAIRYGSAINAGKWQGMTRDNAAGEGVADLGTTVATATLYRLRVEIDKAKTEARYYLNGVYVGRVTANIPNSNACQWEVMIDKDAGTNARQLFIHSVNCGAIYP